MAIKKIFKSTMPHLVFVTKRGKNLMFSNNKHITDNEDDIKELELEIKSQHPHIFVDSAESQIDTTLQDEIAEAQRTATIAVLEKHAKAKLELEENSEKVVGQINTAAVTPVANVQQPQAPATMSAASLLGVTNSASLAGLSAPSNAK